jgi:hypothetical protein
MFNSTTATNSDSLTVNIPVCDSWGNILVGTANAGQPTVLGDGAGVLNVSRTSPGLYGVTFTNPNQYGSGGYIMLFTPEITGTPAIVGSQRWMGGVGGSTAAGRTLGFVFTTYAQQTPVGPSGGTFSPADFTYNSLRVNFAAFNLGYDRDIYSHQVANLFTNTNDWTSWAIQGGNAYSFRVATPSEYPDILSPQGTLSGVIGFTADPSAGAGYFAYINNGTITTVASGLKDYTFSLFALPVEGATLSMLIGGVGNNFGCEFNCDTGAVVPTGTVGGALGKTASGSIMDMGNGWKRCAVTVRNAVPTTLQPLLQMNAKEFLLWGPQFEEGTQATRFTPTGASVPVLGDQDARKTLTPGSAGYGLTGNTYNSHMPNLFSKRTATAYGTIVIVPKKNNHVEYIDCYLENAFNVAGVSAMLDSPYSVRVNFLKHAKDTNYCVILDGEYEPIFANPDYGNIREWSILAVNRGSSNNLKTTDGFTVSAYKQRASDNQFVQTSYSSTTAGVYEKIHFMVFGGGTYGSS